MLYFLGLVTGLRHFFIVPLLVVAHHLVFDVAFSLFLVLLQTEFLGHDRPPLFSLLFALVEFGLDVQDALLHLVFIQTDLA